MQTHNGKTKDQNGEVKDPQAQNQVEENMKEAKEECAACKSKSEEAEEYKAKYLRALADYQNFERRMQEQRVEWIKSANKTLILKLLSFLDDLDRAELFIKDQNLIHVKNSFYKTLKGEGLEEIELMNTEYNPETAEVVNMAEGKEDGLIVGVLRKGYRYNGQIVRVAQVTVSKKA